MSARATNLSSRETSTPRAGGVVGFVAQGDGAAGQGGHKFEQRAVQTHGATALHTAFSLREHRIRPGVCVRRS